jgi:XTP/dITP diphosphohydrolase
MTSDRPVSLTTPRRFDGRVVVATHNPGKLAEMRDLLLPFGGEAVSAGELGLPEPEETGETFRANAELKARAAAQASGLPAIADDSGLCVEALGGAPGVYSARWAGPSKDFGAAMRRIEAALRERDDFEAGERRAAFVSAIALVWPNGDLVEVEGRVDGVLVWPPRGPGGFGYDPMFAPQGSAKTFGEMSAQEKHAVSHRARAFAALAAALAGEST